MDEFASPARHQKRPLSHRTETHSGEDDRRTQPQTLAFLSNRTLRLGPDEETPSHEQAFLQGRLPQPRPPLSAPAGSIATATGTDSRRAPALPPPGRPRLSPGSERRRHPQAASEPQQRRHTAGSGRTFNFLILTSQE